MGGKERCSFAAWAIVDIPQVRGSLILSRCERCGLKLLVKILHNSEKDSITSCVVGKWM